MDKIIIGKRFNEVPNHIWDVGVANSNCWERSLVGESFADVDRSSADVGRAFADAE